jgi:subtilisin family serine protease
MAAATWCKPSGRCRPAGGQPRHYITFAAPCARIWTPTSDTVGQYQTGTSFATPFVAGAAALELMTGSPAEPMELRRRLAGHAPHLGAPGRNPVYG